MTDASVISSTSSVAGGILMSLGAVFVGIFFFYLALIFFVGLMIYYFSGDKKHGESLLNSMMRTTMRLYTYTWMSISSLLLAVGFTLLLKVLIGMLFAGFVYAKNSGAAVHQADLQLGLIMTITSVIIYIVHWGISKLVQTSQDKRGTLIPKLFNFGILFITSWMLFGGLFSFLIELLVYIQTGPSTYGAKPGATLALILGSFPVWLAYLVKSVWMVQKEE